MNMINRRTQIFQCHRFCPREDKADTANSSPTHTKKYWIFFVLIACMMRKVHPICMTIRHSCPTPSAIRAAVAPLFGNIGRQDDADEHIDSDAHRCLKAAVAQTERNSVQAGRIIFYEQADDQIAEQFGKNDSEQSDKQQPCGPMGADPCADRIERSDHGNDRQEQCDIEYDICQSAQEHDLPFSFIVQGDPDGGACRYENRT